MLSKKTLNVVVTGGLGQVGRALLKRVPKSWRVVVLDRFTLGTSPTSIVSAIPIDLSDRRALEGVATGLAACDVVVHLCGAINLKAPVRQLYSSNVQSLIHTLDVIGPKQVVLASSSMVYGVPGDEPFEEAQTLQPTTPYGVFKVAAEEIVNVYARRNGLVGTSLRLTGLYGPGPYSPGTLTRAIPNFLLRAAAEQHIEIHGDPEEERDYLHVSDAARAIILAVESRVGGSFNIGSGNGIAVEMLAHMILDEFGRQRDLVRMTSEHEAPNSTRRYVLDCGKAKEVFGFVPTIPLRQGLNEAVRRLTRFGEL